MIDDTQDGREPPAAPEVDVAALIARLRKDADSWNLVSGPMSAVATSLLEYDAAAALLAQQRTIAEQAEEKRGIATALQAAIDHWKARAETAEAALAAARRMQMDKPDDAALCRGLREAALLQRRDIDTTCCHKAAARIEQLGSERDAAVRALRAEVIHGMTKDPRTYTVTHHLCQLCKADWLAEGPEAHAAGCIAAIAGSGTGSGK